MRAAFLFAILASFLLLLGCASQQAPEKTQGTPEKTQGTPAAPAVQKQPAAQTESAEELHQELDKQDAAVQESITDLDSFQ